MSELSYAPISSVPVSDGFFDTLRADYPGFDDWLQRKVAESAYVARREDGGIDGFLYLKLEDGAVSDVQPAGACEAAEGRHAQGEPARHPEILSFGGGEEVSAV